VPIGGRAADALVGGVELSTASGWISAPVYDRSRLGAGAEISGPAVVTQLDSTTLLLPGQTGRVHRLGSLIVTTRVEERPAGSAEEDVDRSIVQGVQGRS